MLKHIFHMQLKSCFQYVLTKTHCYVCETAGRRHTLLGQCWLQSENVCVNLHPGWGL